MTLLSFVRNVRSSSRALPGSVLAVLALAGALHSTSGRAQGVVADLAERDLAIVLPAVSPRDQGVRANERLSPLPAVFEKAWFDTVHAAFGSTAVGDALTLENGFEDWRLVSLRVVPCSPFGSSLAVDADAFCWPELRTVWQPVLEGPGTVIGRPTRYFADDRAIHVLFDVPADLLGDAAKSSRASSLLAKAKAFANGKGPALSSEETASFATARNEVARRFLSDARALRAGSYPTSAYRGVEVRPEYGDAADARTFKAKLVTFLAKHGPSSRVKELTAFSLPEGRQPPLLDEWVFLAFEGNGGRLVQKDITLHSARDGRQLFNFGKVLSGAQRRDDPLIYDALDGGRMSAADRAEIEASVMLFADSPRALRGAVSDRRKLLVPNTSCASCHKMNSDLFDFHNLSYLEDKDVTVSPRVIRDVEIDLSWARALR